MPKFTKTIDELVTKSEKWIYLLRNLPSFDRIPDKLKEKIFKKVFKISEICNFTPEQQYVYEESLKNARDFDSHISTAFNAGKREGKQEQLLEIIKNAKKYNLPMIVFVNLTGLSENEIRKLI